jgi:autoinducer 2-degrading protein
MAMIVTCVYVNVKSAAIDKFIEITTENHLQSVKEKGNIRFDLIQQADDKSKFMIYEAYESEEAAAAHKNTEHYLVWRDAVQDLMAEPRKGVRYNIIQPKNINR